MQCVPRGSSCTACCLSDPCALLVKLVFGFSAVLSHGASEDANLKKAWDMFLLSLVFRLVGVPVCPSACGYSVSQACQLWLRAAVN